jgi:molybdate transport system substrate-binding protein
MDAKYVVSHLGYDHNALHRPRKGETVNRAWLAAVVAFVVGVTSSLSIIPHGTAAGPTEVKVLSSVAVKAALDDLASMYERSIGGKVAISYATAGEIKNRIQGGEAVDVTILPKARMDELAQQGKIVPGTLVRFVSAALGLAVRAGAPKPDISSPDAPKRSLLAAKSISYADPAKGGLSGVQFARVLERLGISQEMKPRTKLVPGPEAPDLVARGQVEIAVAMIPEIVPVRGADLVGPLPQEPQIPPNFLYVVGTPETSKAPDAAKTFIEFISGPNSAPFVKSKGMEPG